MNDNTAFQLVFQLKKNIKLLNGDKYSKGDLLSFEVLNAIMQNTYSQLDVTVKVIFK